MSTQLSSPSHFTAAGALSLAALCLDADTAEALRDFAVSRGGLRPPLELHTYLLAPGDSLLASLEGERPDICLVDFDSDPAGAARAAARIHAELPDTDLIAISQDGHSQAILLAMRSGCGEYLSKPLAADELGQALERVRSRKRELGAARSGAQVLLFMGSKGGVGATALATQLGMHLAQHCHRRTLLADLQPVAGAAALYLGIAQPPYHFFDLADNANRLDQELLPSFLARHASGLDLLPGPESAIPPRLSTSAVLQTLDFLRGQYDFLLLDCPYGLDELNLELVRACQRLYLITVAELVALRNAARLLQLLAEKDVPREKTQVVLNRYAKRAAFADAQITRALKQELFRKIPNQYPQLLRALSAGDASALAGSELTRNLQAWAEMLAAPGAVDGARPGARGWLGRLSRTPASSRERMAA